MTIRQIRQMRLARQHLLAPADTGQVVKDLCGVQAQFLTHALHGLTLRCGTVNTGELVKSWTIRGTMHLFSEDDLPLFLHEGRRHSLRPMDTMQSDALVTGRRKAYFSELILNAVGEGSDQREALKQICTTHGMTEGESQSLFDPWGGIIRALCEAGKLCHKVQQQKAYRLCPAFTPMEEEPARLELARRYFTHFGPATIRDGAYFFGKPQSQLRRWLAQLPAVETTLDAKTFFHIEGGEGPGSAIPACLFLAGFDQLMLGYEKTESLFLPREFMSEIFTRAGIVRPVVLIHGMAAGWWSLRNRKLTIHTFMPQDNHFLETEARRQWPDLLCVVFE